MTTEQNNAAIEIIKAIADTIKELGSVPSGHLYAQLMGSMSLDVYEGIINTLIRTGLIEKQKSHLLVWKGRDK